MRKSLLNALYGVYWDSGEHRAPLILSRSGVYHFALYDAGWVHYMPEPGSKTPGEYWIYNNWDFNALGTIFTQASGTTIHEAFAAEIAKPLKLQDFDEGDCRISK
ncbi:MAG: serine hydrolase [Gammaproteobacteria bacterium]|nr:serine hydrolase [Gammaproteobacteria bacterium]